MPQKQSDDEARRASSHRAIGSTADMAVEGHPSAQDCDIETPYAREAEPLVDSKKHDQLADKEACAEDRQEALLDEAIEETFPSSDPISPKHIT
jgi:hypothetical protein